MGSVFNVTNTVFVLSVAPPDNVKLVQEQASLCKCVLFFKKISNKSLRCSKFYSEVISVQKMYMHLTFS